jgi:hypothetical protein
MEKLDLTAEDKEVVVETHYFTTIRYKNQADNGFSGNVALLVEAVQHSDKVHDENLKILARGIFESVIKHAITTHKREDIEEAVKKMKEDERAKMEAKPAELT